MRAQTELDCRVMVVEVEKLANKGAVILVDMEVDKLAEEVAV